MSKSSKHKRSRAPTRRLNLRKAWKTGKPRLMTGRNRARNRPIKLWLYHSRESRIQPSNPLYSKIDLTEAERLWLEICCPKATIIYRYVTNYEKTPAFCKDGWNGKAWFVRFDDHDEAESFRRSCLRQRF